ncbi:MULTISPECIES: hypothetical protein [Moorena]|uniref:hypothetical protein n=1 Tax=Moorena TaxID=1155738 RepID=UPI0011EA6C48|nr:MULTISPECIES: hypothetical protein [Moorena]NEO81383.1 hypothetical protein [Moorena sp. SIO4G3]
MFRRGGASRVVNKACRVSVRAASAKADTVGWSWQEAHTVISDKRVGVCHSKAQAWQCKTDTYFGR